MSKPTVVIHGGAGRAIGSESREAKIRRALEEILDKVWQRAVDGESAVELAEYAGVLLEDCEHFNAGRGSKIQSDGSVRMSAALMDGERCAFSGIVNAQDVQNPTVMAARLQGEPDRVLDARGAELLAREMKLPIFDPVVERQLQKWWEETRKERGFEAKEEEPSPSADERGMGTVGAVVRDVEGRLAASTSTGGRGFERIGRVSDTPTVAGNYATEAAAVSATGIGEDIVDEALAARIVVMVEGGMELEDALKQAMERARGRERRFGVIAVDAEGRLSWAKTTEILLGAGRRGEQIRWAF